MYSSKTHFWNGTYSVHCKERYTKSDQIQNKCPNALLSLMKIRGQYVY